LFAAVNASTHHPLALLGAYNDLGKLSLPVAGSLVLDLLDAFELVLEKFESLPWVVFRLARALALESASMLGLVPGLLRTFNEPEWNLDAGLDDEPKTDLDVDLSVFILLRAVAWLLSISVSVL